MFSLLGWAGKTESSLLVSVAAGSLDGPSIYIYMDAATHTGSCSQGGRVRQDNYTTHPWLYGDPEYQNPARIQRQQSGKPGKTCRQQRTGYIKAMQGMFHCNQHLRSPSPRDTASVCANERQSRGQKLWLNEKLEELLQAAQSLSCWPGAIPAEDYNRGACCQV